MIDENKTKKIFFEIEKILREELELVDWKITITTSENVDANKFVFSTREMPKIVAYLPGYENIKYSIINK